MNLLINFNKFQLLEFYNFTFNKCGYSKAIGALGTSKKKKGKTGPMIEKKVLPVETNPEKLVNYCCGSNLFKTGEDVKLKPDNEYPEWLWSVRTGPPPSLEELDRNSKEYWKKVRKMGMRRNNQLLKLKKF